MCINLTNASQFDSDKFPCSQKLQQEILEADMNAIGFVQMPLFRKPLTQPTSRPKKLESSLVLKRQRIELEKANGSKKCIISLTTIE